MPDQSGRSLSEEAAMSGDSHEASNKPSATGRFVDAPTHQGRCKCHQYPGFSDATWPWALCPNNPSNELTADMLQPEEKP